MRLVFFSYSRGQRTSGETGVGTGTGAFCVSIEDARVVAAREGETSNTAKGGEVKGRKGRQRDGGKGGRFQSKPYLACNTQHLTFWHLQTGCAQRRPRL